MELACISKGKNKNARCMMGVSLIPYYPNPIAPHEHISQRPRYGLIAIRGRQSRGSRRMTHEETNDKANTR